MTTRELCGHVRENSRFRDDAGTYEMRCILPAGHIDRKLLPRHDYRQFALRWKPRVGVAQ